MTRRVVITGVGTVNPLASDVKEFWRALCAGRSGIGRIELIDTSAFKVKFGGEVKNFSPETVLDPKVARRLDRFAQFALVAAVSAVKDSGLDFSREDLYRCGVILGSGIGGLTEFEEQHARFMQGGPGKISPFVIPKMIPNAAPGNVSIHFGLCGPNTAVSTACASAAHATWRCAAGHPAGLRRCDPLRWFRGGHHEHGLGGLYLRPRPVDAQRRSASRQPTVR